MINAPPKAAGPNALLPSSVTVAAAFTFTSTLDASPSNGTRLIEPPNAASWLELALLFLNNNLHVAHHDEPWVPWYDYREVVGRVRAIDRAQEAGLLYRGGYAEVFRRFAFRPMDHPVQGGV